MNNVSTLVTRRADRSFTFTDRMARNLGWFSIGLGLAELIAPGRIARAVGLEGKETLLRGYGAREIVAGVGALSVDPTPAMWSRVGGDLLDLGTLAIGAREGDKEQRRNAGIAIAAVGVIAVLDLLVAAGLTRERNEDRGQVRDYSDRSGFPGGAAKARGAARDFETPKDMQAELPTAQISQEYEPA